MVPCFLKIFVSNYTTKSGITTAPCRERFSFQLLSFHSEKIPTLSYPLMSRLCPLSFLPFYNTIFFRQYAICTRSLKTSFHARPVALQHARIAQSPTHLLKELLLYSTHLLFIVCYLIFISIIPFSILINYFIRHSPIVCLRLPVRLYIFIVLWH